MKTATKAPAKAKTPKAETKPAPKVSLKLIVGDKDIGAAIATLQRRGASFFRDVHKVACSILQHVDQHHNVTLANRLLDALPDATRKNPLRDWFISFGRMTYDEENKVIAYNRDAVTLLDDAMAKPFWEFKPEQAYIPFDMHKAIQNVLKAAARAQKKGDPVPQHAIKVLTELDALLVTPIDGKGETVGHALVAAQAPTTAPAVELQAAA
jgi:hypothetical protein